MSLLSDAPTSPSQPLTIPKIKSPSDITKSSGPVIIIDTREQLPYFWGDDQPTIRRALPAGDYSIDGYETRVAVERKTLDDFVNTITWGRARFMRELAKLQQYDMACVVVEGNLTQVAHHKYRSQAHPNSVLGTVIAICVDFDVPVFWCDGRQRAMEFTRRWLLRWAAKVNKK
jgi:DNA excision repair protein ERCC-4